MKPVWIVTENVKNLVSTMEFVKKRMGHDSIATIWGHTGRGKTDTCKWYIKDLGWIYILALKQWNPYWMYRDIALAMGADKKPRGTREAFDMIKEINEKRPLPIVLDEADKLGAPLLESVRDLCLIMEVPWILIGEEDLPVLIRSNERLESRQCASLEFKKMSIQEVKCYGEQVTGDEGKDNGLSLSVEVADKIRVASSGDIRKIELILSASETIAKANSLKELTPQIATKAIKKVSNDKSKRNKSKRT